MAAAFDRLELQQTALKGVSKQQQTALKCVSK